MNKTTSNDTMEREFDILQSVQKLQPSADLYHKILSRVTEQDMTISKKWLAGVAVMITALICLEVFIITQPTDKTSNTNEIETLVQKENYHLYE